MNPQNPEVDRHQPGPEQRRSWRFPVIVVVLVKWEQGNVMFSEDAQALEASLYGASLRMKTHPPVGAKIELTNRLSNETVQAQVVAIRHSKSAAVAVELLLPSETFWGTTFRLKKAAADLRTLEQEIKQGGADPRVLLCGASHAPSLRGSFQSGSSIWGWRPEASAPARQESRR